MRGIYLGLDCGGSSSRAVAVDAEGATLFQGQSGSANLVSTPMFRLKRNLEFAARGCPEPDFVCGCFAGLVTEEDRSRALDLMRGFWPKAKLRAEPDYTAAFFASGPETDICLIAGTGSLVCSWDGNHIVKSGGRGYLLGDQGSAFCYGRDALMAYLSNPRGSSNALKKYVLEVFDAEDEPTIVSRLYRSPSPQAHLAKLAKALAADARAGAAYALDSICHHSSELAHIVLEHCRCHLPSTEEVEICLSGGLWKISPFFAEGMAEHLTRGGLKCRLARIQSPPVFGAVRLAQEMANGN